MYAAENVPPELDRFETEIIEKIFEEGQATIREDLICWPWRGKEYLGAAHGAAGILTMLLGSFDRMDATRRQKLRSMCYALRIVKRDGFYPSSLESHRAPHDALVQW